MWLTLGGLQYLCRRAAIPLQEGSAVVIQVVPSNRHPVLAIQQLLSQL